MKYFYVFIFFFLSVQKGFSLSLDEKVTMDRKISTFSSFEDAKKQNVISGIFYDVGGEKGFEKLSLAGEYAALGPSCAVKGYVMGYSDIENPLFISSLPKSSVDGFSENLYSLNFTYTVSVSLVFEFSEGCKNNDSFPDVVVVHLR